MDRSVYLYEERAMYMAVMLDPKPNGFKLLASERLSGSE